MSNKVYFKRSDFAGGRLKDIYTRKQATDPLGKRSLLKELTAYSYLPADLLKELEREFSQPFTDHARAGLGLKTLPNRILEEGKLKDSKVAVFIAEQVNRYPRAYFAFYRALLHAMDRLLQNPNIPVKSRVFEQRVRSPSSKSRKPDVAVPRVVREKFSRSVPLRVYDQGKQISKNIRLEGNWPGLTQFTLEQKEQLGYPPTFWKHTMEASHAFHEAVTARLAHIKPRSFVVQDRPELKLVGESLGKSGPGRRVAVARYKFAIGVPKWNKKMDALITLPFTSGISPSTQIASGASFRTPKGRVRKLHGIDRIMVAEAYRPWLRNLSKQAGWALLSYLEGGARATPTSSEFVSGLHSELQTAEKAEKARKWKETQDKWEKAREEKAAKKAARAAQPKEKKVITAKQRAEGRAAEKAGMEKAQVINAKVRQSNAAKEKVKTDRTVDQIKASVERVKKSPKHAAAKSPKPATARSPKTAKQAAQPLTKSTQTGRKDALQKRIQELEKRTYQDVFNEAHASMVAPGHKLSLNDLDRLREIANERYQTQVVKPLEDARNRLKKFK
jgi:hypothetical protein